MKLDSIFKFDNCAQNIGKYGDYYKWKVFMDAPRDRLNQVKGVEYRLDKTYPNPIRYIEDRENKFALSLSGRSGFTIYITIYFVKEIDGKNEINTHHYLDLKKTCD